MPETPLYVLKALAEMEHATARIQFEAAMGANEIQMFGQWQCDHSAACEHFDLQFSNAKHVVETYCQSL